METEPKQLWDVEIIREDQSKATDDDFLCIGASKSEAFRQISNVIGHQHALVIIGKCYVDECDVSTSIKDNPSYDKGDSIRVSYREEYTDEY